MFEKFDIFFRCFIFAVVSACLFLATGCGINKIIPTDQKGKVPMASAYRKAVIHQFEADQALAQKNPHAAGLCENATFQELLQIGTFPIIVKTSSSASLREAGTIVIKVRLAYIRETKQTRLKTKVVYEIMAAQVRLIDAATGETIHDQYVSLTDPPSTKASGNAAELGKWIARHINRVVENK